MRYWSWLRLYALINHLIFFLILLLHYTIFSEIFLVLQTRIIRSINYIHVPYPIDIQLDRYLLTKVLCWDYKLYFILHFFMLLIIFQNFVSLYSPYNIYKVLLRSIQSNKKILECLNLSWFFIGHLLNLDIIHYLNLYRRNFFLLLSSHLKRFIN